MSVQRLIALFCLTCGLAGCGKETASETSDAVTPDVIASYQASLCLASEPTQVVSILDIRSHLAEPSHDADPAASQHDHADHEGHNHATDENHDHDHDHDGHDADGQHGHDHAAPIHRDSVVLVGKVGGAPGAERSSPNFPFEKGKASFVMFDPAFEHAEGEGHSHAEGHECHFCQSKAQDAQAIVRFMGKDGKPIPVDTQELFGIKENDVVVVQGMASVQAGMLIVEGDGIFIRE